MLKIAMKGRYFATNDQIKTESLKELKSISKVSSRSASKIGKSADTGVLFLSEITLKETILKNKYFLIN